MRTLKSCNRTKHMGRCHTPLIEICDTTSQIKLDLGSCGVCATKPAALWLKKGGCIEYEVVCEQPKLNCCDVVDNRPVSYLTKQSRPIPKPSILYPIHEVDPQGMSVFALDGKMKDLGYGRWHAIILLLDNATAPKNRPLEITDYYETDIMFDVDYIPYKLGMNSISVSTLQPYIGDC